MGWVAELAPIEIAGIRLNQAKSRTPIALAARFSQTQSINNCMPIGTVDYVSTLPWNDSMNPWPAYAQVSLSAADIQGGAWLTYTLVQFDPTLPGAAMFYSANTEEGNYLTYDGTYWRIIAQEEYAYYYYESPVRGIPAGYKQGNMAWESDMGSEANTLSIIADTTVLTPWEYRRRRLLEIV
jgi:hypothetical protein